MKKRIKLAAGFAAAVVLLQGLALLFLTPAGISSIYPIFLRVCAERTEPEGNTYAVYYDTRVQVSEADLIVIAADGNVAESYDLLGHFIRFVKQYNNFSDLMLDFDRVSEKISSVLMDEQEEKEFYHMLDLLRDYMGMSEDYCDFLSEMFVVNRTMTPMRRFSVESYSSQAHYEGMSCAEKIALTFEGCERSAVCVVDAEEMISGGTFEKELTELLPDRKVMFIKTFYTKDSFSPDTHETIGFPFAPKDGGIYFADNRSFAAIYDYYDSVTGIFGADSSEEIPLKSRFTPFYFVVASGSEPELSDIALGIEEDEE